MPNFRSNAAVNSFAAQRPSATRDEVLVALTGCAGLFMRSPAYRPARWLDRCVAYADVRLTPAYADEPLVQGRAVSFETPPP